MLQDLKEVPADEDFPAAQGQNEDARRGHLHKQILDLGRGHFAVIVMIQIAMDAALVTAISQVQVSVQRNAMLQRRSAHLGQQGTHGVSSLRGLEAIGWSETSRMPSWARPSKNSSAS